MPLPHPIPILRRYQRAYPDAWKWIARMRADRGKPGGVPAWSDWCYAPLATAYGVVSGGDGRVPHERLGDVAAVAATAAWRMTKGVYRLDRALLGALWEQPVDEAVEADELTGLPEWCVYLDLAGSGLLSFFPTDAGSGTSGSSRMPEATALRGAFVHLEEDLADGHAELRFLLDFGDAEPPMGVPLDLGGTLEEGFRSMSTEVLRNAQRAGASLPFELGGAAAFAEAVRPLVSVAAYLASSRAEYEQTDADGVPTGSGRQPANPTPVGKKGRTPALPTVTYWAVS